MTLELFREDGYLKTCDATVTQVDERGVQLNQTVFYPKGGGQPGDTGTLTASNGSSCTISDTYKENDEHIHTLDTTDHSIQTGDTVTVTLDWDRRHRFMRMHSCMHMLCALIDAPVTGGSIQADKARLDFDLEETLDKEKLSTALNALIQADHKMQISWITDAELDEKPELVRTMSVKPPRGSGKIRLINFEGIDLQPCGGTHVASTAEIGKVRVRKIEKKGRQNRRVIVVFDEPA